jgi:hypothetical protein
MSAPVGSDRCEFHHVQFPFGLFIGDESLFTAKMTEQFLTAYSSIRHPSPPSITPQPTDYEYDRRKVTE